MLTLEIRFNHIRTQRNAVIAEHRGAFSNSRMIVADFEAFQTALKATLNIAAEKQLYTPPSKIFGNLRTTPICLDIRENLADGLSPIEYKVLHDILLVLGTNKVKPEQILYQGKIVFQTS